MAGNAMYEMQLELETHLFQIQETLKYWNLPLTRLTLIARDPDNDRMIIVLGNETQSGLEKACLLARQQAEVKYP